MIRLAHYMETLRTDDKELAFLYLEGPKDPPLVQVTITDRIHGTYVDMEVEPDVLRSALESLFGGIYSGEA